MCNECTQICPAIKRMAHVMKLWNFFIFCVLCVPALAACGTKERAFPGHTRDQVWKAMVQAAEDPRYADWIVVDNEVWRDDAASRIEIRRDVRRDLMVAGSPPRREEFEWRFSASVTDATPPSVEFSTSTIVIPAHFWLQARHYLDEVERRLSGMPLEKKATITQYSSTDSSRLPDHAKPFPVVAVSQSDANAPPEIASPRSTQAAVIEPPVSLEDLQVAPIAVAEPVVEVTPTPVADPVAEVAPTPVTEPVAEPVVEVTPTPVAEPVVEVAPIAVAEPVVEVAPIPVAEPVVEVAPIPVAQPVADPEVEPVAEPVAEPVVEVAPIPVAEPVVEVAPIAVAEPVVEVAPTPVAEPIVEVAPIPVAEPVVEVAPIAVAEPVVEVAPIAVTEPVVEVAPIPVAQPVADPEVEPVAEPVAEPVVEVAPIPVAEPVVEVAPIAVAEPVVEVAPTPVAEPVVEDAPIPDADEHRAPARQARLCLSVLHR